MGGASKQAASAIERGSLFPALERPFCPEPENLWPFDEVAFPQALWLTGESEKPFHTAALHPFRRAFCPAGEKIKRSPDAKAEPDTVAAVKTGFGYHFLLRAADANKDIAGWILRNKFCGFCHFIRLMTEAKGRLIMIDFSQAIERFHSFNNLGVCANDRDSIIIGNHIIK